MNYEKIELPMWVILSFVLFCFPILLLTGGQSAFVSLLFVFSFFILKYLLGERGKTESISFGVVALMLIGILFINTGHHDEREQMLNDSWDRFELWRSGIFANTDFLWGVGTGDYKSVLNEYYRKTGQELFARESLNSHNQFIQIFFSNGFLGLIAFSIIIIRPLYMAFRNNDQLGILLIFPFLIYGMTEVFLGRYQGVVFFALLHQTLVSFYVNSKSTLIEIK
jgi:O-antigen ligase